MPLTSASSSICKKYLDTAWGCWQPKIDLVVIVSLKTSAVP